MFIRDDFFQLLIFEWIGFFKLKEIRRMEIVDLNIWLRRLLVGFTVWKVAPYFMVPGNQQL